MFRIAIAALTTLVLCVPARSNLIFDGIIIIMSAENCVVRKGDALQAVASVHIASKDPASALVVFFYRNTFHMTNNSATSQFNGAGKYKATIIGDAGDVEIATNRNYNLTITPNPITNLTLNFDIKGTVWAGDCGPVTIRGGFGRRP